MAVNNLHVAIVMDGNSRWAKKNDVSVAQGHKKGAQKAKEIISHCANLPVKYLTLFAFSSENWQRPENEVNYLMDLIGIYLKKELGNLHKNGVCIKIIGDIAKIPNNIRIELENAVNITKNNDKLFLTVALSYGARQEITRAIKNIAHDLQNNSININDINEDLIAKSLYTSDIPDPDILIRTSGEKRISNFLLWQLAYTELFFIDELWPDFSPSKFDEIIVEFQNRERRFGAR
jgi:undecaprenyl diphosphate synthase